MIVIKGVSAKSISDSRGEETIEVSIKTNAGSFSASAPNGKSKGKHEAKSYKKSLNDDIKMLEKLSDYFSKDRVEKFGDLKIIEDIVDGHVGANTLFAFESAVLKALAKEDKKEIWELINPNAKKFPRLVGNCVGGGKHSSAEKKPDFQEFLLIPDATTINENQKINLKKKDLIMDWLKSEDEKQGDTSKDKVNPNRFSIAAKPPKNDEDAWQTSLNEKAVLDLLKETEIPLGVDVASSSFYSRKKYLYKNPMLKRDSEEQFTYISNLINNFNLFYVEDPFYEDDFESFAKLLEKFPKSLIVGDDLTVTNFQRLEKAIKMKSINAMIVKPNQNGSLIEVKRVCELAKKNGIKIIFSHRSGETNENILADLAFGFQADFFKCGITGKEREAKIHRLIEIEKSLRK